MALPREGLFIFSVAPRVPRGAVSFTARRGFTAFTSFTLLPPRYRGYRVYRGYRLGPFAWVNIREWAAFAAELLAAGCFTAP